MLTSDPAPAVLDRLYLEHYRRLVRLAANLVDNRETAEDVVQDAFVSLCRRADLTSLDAPYAYLRTAVLNAARSAMRKRLVRNRHLTYGPLPLHLAEAGLSTEEFVTLRSAVRSLPMRQRQIVVLRYYEGLDTNEIAEILNISPSAVSSSLSKAIKRLTDSVDDWRTRGD